jgi:hypothetical protein
MATYRAIAASETDADSPVTATLMTALADNPTAIAEGAANSPVNQWGWHPYDMVNVGDGNDGVFYDHSVDGSVASVETPDFEDGYEYRIIGDNLGRGAVAVTIELYLATAASYSTLFTSTNTSAFSFGFDFETRAPRLDSNFHIAEGEWVTQNGQQSVAGFVYNGTAQKLGKVRIGIASGNMTSGTMRLYRRLFVL